MLNDNGKIKKILKSDKNENELKNKYKKHGGTSAKKKLQSTMNTGQAHFDLLA